MRKKARQELPHAHQPNSVFATLAVKHCTITTAIDSIHQRRNAILCAIVNHFGESSIYIGTGGDELTRGYGFDGGEAILWHPGKWPALVPHLPRSPLKPIRNAKGKGRSMSPDQTRRKRKLVILQVDDTFSLGTRAFMTEEEEASKLFKSKPRQNLGEKGLNFNFITIVRNKNGEIWLCKKKNRKLVDARHTESV